MVSVLMCAYNEPIKWLKESIYSILNQTYSNFEFIIVNDNPQSIELHDFLMTEAQKDARITIITNVENLGLTKSLNVGIKYCHGKYIARMDADDISLPQRLAKQVAFMESNPSVIVCGSRIKYFGQSSLFKSNTVFSRDIDIRGQMLLDSGFVHPSVVIRKEVLDINSIKYDENFRTSQDYKLWFDLSPYGDFANIEEVLLYYRLSSKQVSSVSSFNQSQARIEISKKFREKGIGGYILDTNKYTNKIEIVSCPTLINNRALKVIKAYYHRSLYYSNFSLKSMCKVAFSLYTKITLKERFLVILLLIKKKIY